MRPFSLSRAVRTVASLPRLRSDRHSRPALARLLTGGDGSRRYEAAGNLEGKKAIITDGDTGIGRANAILFAIHGADRTIL